MSQLSITAAQVGQGSAHTGVEVLLRQVKSSVHHFQNHGRRSPSNLYQGVEERHRQVGCPK